MSELRPFDESLFAQLLDRVSDGVAIAAPKPWRLLYANRILAERLGHSADELRGRPLEELFDPDARTEALELAELAYQGKPPEADVAGVEFRRIVAGEQTLLGVVVRHEASVAAATPGASERRDPLTGLRDRRFLMQRLAALLRGERSGDHRFAVLFVDLDNFKLVNDAHGHLVGDRVLREVGRRLTGCVRDGDHVVRFGGDEFVVLIAGAAGGRDVEPIVNRIHTALEKPVALANGEFRLSLSIGAAIATPDHRSPEDLLGDADRAMYAAKRARNAGSSLPAVE